MRRQLVSLVVLGLLLAVSAPVVAHADAAPFDTKAFAAAQDAGKSIVVHVHATW